MAKGKFSKENMYNWIVSASDRKNSMSLMHIRNRENKYLCMKIKNTSYTLFGILPFLVY
jgi:hypothetical protein